MVASGLKIEDFLMMPRGVTPTRVRRRQSDAKWRASVAMCYGIMKHVIPNQRKLGRRKISKAFTLKETERHLVNLERVLKELLTEKARMYGKTVMLPKENNILKTATFEDVRSDYDDRQLHFFSSTTGTGKKRYNVPTDVEASLDHLSLQSCPLVVLSRGDTKPQVAVNSEKLIEQEVPHPVGMVANKHMLDVKSSTLESLLTTPLGVSPKYQPHMVSKPAGCMVRTPCKGQQGKTEKVIRLRIGSVTPARQSSDEKPDVTPAKDTNAKTEHSSTPSKACKQLPFSQASGFTPIKLPPGLDGTQDQFSSFPSTPANSVFGSAIGSPFSGFSLPETPSSCFNGVDYFDDTNEDSSSLLCTETIENFDLDDVINTPPGPVRDGVERATNNSAVRNLQTTLYRTPSGTGRDPEETETDESLVKNTQERYGDDFGLRKIKSAKCRRRLDRSYHQKEARKPVDESCNEFDGFLLFYNQNAGEIELENNFEDKEVTVAKMWKNLAADEKAAYSKIASLENSNDSIHLSDDLRGLDLKPLSRTGQEVSFVPEDSPQEVPDLDLHPSMFSGSSDLEYDLVPEYADLGIIYNEDIGKEVAFGQKGEVSQEESHMVPDISEDCQVVPDIYVA